jgi:hypothetical protein
MIGPGPSFGAPDQTGPIGPAGGGPIGPVHLHLRAGHGVAAARQITPAR